MTPTNPQHACVMYDLDGAGNEVNHLYIADPLPEKRYPDRCDHYGDIRTHYRQLTPERTDENPSR